MLHSTQLDWPFFDDTHRRLGADIGRWVRTNLDDLDHPDIYTTCRGLVKKLGAAGWLRYCVPAAFGGTQERPEVAGFPFARERQDVDSRALCLLRETLAYHDGLADFAFAMQGLGSGAITLAGSTEQKSRYLPRVAKGEAIAAFALSEADAGSDVGAMQTSARADGNDFVLDGEKTWISNGGIADFYVVFARTTPRDAGESNTTKPTAGIGAFIVDAMRPGL